MQSPSRSRGFTLVEILTVVVIIGILVGLVAAVAIPARITVKRTRIKTEIANLVLAIENFRSEIGNGEYPPDGNNAAEVTQFLLRAFPRCPASSHPAAGTVNPGNALYFWLAGPTGNGFSRNPANPFDPNPSRIGPFYEFDTRRLNATNGQYRPQNDVAQSGPYVYFRPQQATHPGWNWTNPATNATVKVQPFRDALSTGSSLWVNPRSCQVLSPGLDGKYAATADGNPPIYPTGTNYPAESYDDITSFSTGTLENDMPN